MNGLRVGRKAIALTAVVGLAALAAACSSGSSTSSEATAAASAAASTAASTAASAGASAAASGGASSGNCINDIFGPGGPEAGQGVTIPAGMLLAVTGQGSFFGHVMSMGAMLAAKQIKEAGGMDYQITVGDHKSGDVPSALTETKKLISDGIEVLQTSYGAPSEAIIPLIQEGGVLTFNGGGSSPAQLSQDFLWMNRMVYAEDPNAGALAWIHKTYPDAKNLALIGTMENGVGTFKETAPANWKALTGGQIVAAEQHDVGATDFKALAQKIKAANPDAVMTFSFGDDLGYQVKALREAGYTGPIMMDEFTSQAAKIAGSAYDGVNFAVDFYSTDNPNPWNQCFVEAWKAEYGDDKVQPVPEYYSSNYYEQVFIVWDLVKRVIKAGGDPNDAAQLQAALIADPTFPSVYGGTADVVGSVTLDKTDHSISKPMGVFEVQNGTPKLLQEIKKIKPGEDPNTALVGG